MADAKAEKMSMDKSSKATKLFKSDAKSGKAKSSKGVSGKSSKSSGEGVADTKASKDPMSSKFYNHIYGAFSTASQSFLPLRDTYSFFSA